VATLRVKAVAHDQAVVAGEAAEFTRSGVHLPGVIGATHLKCGEPAAEAGELIWRQVGRSFGDLAAPVSAAGDTGSRQPAALSA
jgi:hypothetical protein